MLINWLGMTKQQHPQTQHGLGGSGKQQSTFAWSSLGEETNSKLVGSVEVSRLTISTIEGQDLPEPTTFCCLSWEKVAFGKNRPSLSSGFASLARNSSYSAAFLLLAPPPPP